VVAPEFPNNPPPVPADAPNELPAGAAEVLAVLFPNRFPVAGAFGLKSDVVAVLFPNTAPEEAGVPLHSC
jgi:hypothetical protein